MRTRFLWLWVRKEARWKYSCSLQLFCLPLLGPGDAVKCETESVWDNSLIHPRPPSPCWKRVRTEQVLIPPPGNHLCCGTRGAWFRGDHALPSMQSDGIPGLGNVSIYEVSREEQSSHMWYILYFNSGSEGHCLSNSTSWSSSLGYQLISLHTQLRLTFQEIWTGGFRKGAEKCSLGLLFTVHNWQGAPLKQGTTVQIITPIGKRHLYPKDPGDEATNAFTFAFQVRTRCPSFQSLGHFCQTMDALNSLRCHSWFLMRDLQHLLPKARSCKKLQVPNCWRGYSSEPRKLNMLFRN